MKKIILCGFLFVLFAYPDLIFAMKINEIMYDVPGTDSGREWVEIFNDTNTDIDFSSWKLLENAVNHSVKLITGNAVIPAGGYAIIADNDQNFLIDNPDFEGTLFDSVFSLTNTGETLALVNSAGVKIDEISYSDSLGAKGDGNTLQLHEGFLISAKSTPGSKNSNEAIIPEVVDSASTTTNNGTNNVISTHSSPVPIIKIKDTVDFEISIGRERLSSIKSPLIFKAETNEKSGTRNIRHLWNFGDGNQSKKKKPEHFYKNEGTYNVVLNAISGIKHAVARTIVHVVKPKIALNIKENGIEVGNLDSNELNIGLWNLKSENDVIDFTFPQDTIISPRTNIIFDRDLFIKKDELWITNDLNAELLFPTGDLATKTSAIIQE